MTDIHSCSYYCTRPACVLAQRDELRDKLAAQPSAEPWRDAVDQMLMTIEQTATDDPRESINRLINWHISVALDPLVSSDARALVQRGRDEVASQPITEHSDASVLRAFNSITNGDTHTHRFSHAPVVIVSQEHYDALVDEGSAGFEPAVHQIFMGAKPSDEPVAYMYTGIKNDGSTHGPHFVLKPSFMDAMSVSKGAKAVPLYAAHAAQPIADSKLGLHLTHCNFGEYSGACKYGEADCPALTPTFSWIGKQIDEFALAAAPRGECMMKPRDESIVEPVAGEAVSLEQMYAEPDADGWTQWVAPAPDSYMMGCCDCGLVHEMQFRVALYEPRPSEVHEIVDDPNYQAQFRARRAPFRCSDAPEGKQ